MGEMRCVYKILVGKPEGERPLGRPRYRWEDNIKINLRETGLGGVDWNHLAQGPVAGCCEHGNEPLDSIKGREFLDWLSFSRRTRLCGVSYLNSSAA
jgi:hypothetical protein